MVFIAFRGWAIEDLDFTETHMNTFRLHAVPGVLLLLLTLLRLYIKRKNKDKLPQPIAYYSKAHQKLVNIVINLLYVLLILTPLIGFITIYQTGALGYDFGGSFPEGAVFNAFLANTHSFLVYSFITLTGLHVAGVVLYKIKTGENLLKRMCLLIK